MSFLDIVFTLSSCWLCWNMNVDFSFLFFFLENFLISLCSLCNGNMDYVAWNAKRQVWHLNNCECLLLFGEHKFDKSRKTETNHETTLPLDLLLAPWNGMEYGIETSAHGKKEEEKLVSSFLPDIFMNWKQSERNRKKKPLSHIENVPLPKVSDDMNLSFSFNW